MKRVLIQEKLKQLGTSVENIVLGDFDFIGEFTAKKSRDRNSELYKNVGSFFRPNYERGILIHELIRHYHIKTYLEIGFGRGYSTLCAAKALASEGVTEQGSVMTVDPNFDEKHMSILSQIFPNEWLKLIKFSKGYSKDILSESQSKFDMIYIDGDHTEAGTKLDWELCKDRWNTCVLFDDYHPDSSEHNMQCAKVIDSIAEHEFDANEKELVILDRRIFLDDRGYTDDQIKYGQVLMTKKSLSNSPISSWLENE